MLSQEERNFLLRPNDFDRNRFTKMEVTAHGMLGGPSAPVVYVLINDGCERRRPNNFGLDV